jgi:hypothetical protein
MEGKIPVPITSTFGIEDISISTLSVTNGSESDPLSTTIETTKISGGSSYVDMFFAILDIHGDVVSYSSETIEIATGTNSLTWTELSYPVPGTYTLRVRAGTGSRDNISNTFTST